MSNYPITTFSFEVDWGQGRKIGFSEASGFAEFSYEEISYIHGAQVEHIPSKMPGRPQYGDITLKRGAFKNDSDALDLFKLIATDEQARQNVTITLLDATRTPVMVWTIINAWIKQYSGPGLNAGESSAAYESLTLANEGYTQEFIA